MHLVRHLIAVDELPSRGVSRDDNRVQVGKDALVDQFSQNPVGEVEGGQLRVVEGRSARTPAVAVARPVDLVGGALVAAAAAVVRGETGSDDERVVERAGQERGRQRGAEVVVGVAAGAVDHHQRTGQPIVLHLERIGAVDQRACLIAVRDPLGAGRCRRDAGCRGGGNAAQPRCRDQCEQEDARLHCA